MKKRLMNVETKKMQTFVNTSHRERVEAFNKYLTDLTEHHDMPKSETLDWDRLYCILPYYFYIKIFFYCYPSSSCKSSSSSSDSITVTSGIVQYLDSQLLCRY